MKRTLLPKAWLIATALSVFLAVLFSVAGSRTASADPPAVIFPGLNYIPAVNQTNDRMDVRGNVQLNVYNGPTGRPANMAYSWGSCVGCNTFSLAMQVNVVSNRSTIYANNHALAFNFKCSGCTTTAMALQYIIVSQSQTAVVPPDAWGLINSMNGALRSPNVNPGTINGVLSQFPRLLSSLRRYVTTTTANTTPGATSTP
jgi:hypothetical protein